MLDSSVQLGRCERSFTRFYNDIGRLTLMLIHIGSSPPLYLCPPSSWFAILYMVSLFARQAVCHGGARLRADL